MQAPSPAVPEKHVAKALVYDGAGNLLLLRRSATHPRYAFDLDLPGGEVDPDDVGATLEERLLLATQREVAEEAGLQIELGRMAVVFTEQVENGPERNKYYHVCKVQINEVTPPITLSWEHDQYVWVAPDHTIDRVAAAKDVYMRTVLKYLMTNQTDSQPDWA